MGRKGGRERSESVEEKCLTAREKETEERSGRDIEIMSFVIYLPFFFVPSCFCPVKCPVCLKVKHRALV